MAVKKQRRAAPISSQDAEGTRAHLVLLEDMKSQIQVVLEAVTSSREEVRRDLREVDERLGARINNLGEAVKQNSADIQQNSADIKQNSADIKQNSADIRIVREEVAGLRRDFDRRPELERMKALEDRVARVEAKVAGIP